MINKLEPTFGGKFRKDGGSELQLYRAFSRGFRSATVKTSSLVQRCKTIFINASFRND